MRQVSENLGIIVEEGERLTTLINDTLDLAKIEAGRMEWRREPVDVGEVIDRATAATASLLAGAGPELVVERGARPAGARSAIGTGSSRSSSTSSRTPSSSRRRARSPARPGDDGDDGGDGRRDRDRHRHRDRPGGSRPGLRAVRAGRRHADGQAARAPASGCRSAARSSSTTAAGSGSSPRSGAGRTFSFSLPVVADASVAGRASWLCRDRASRRRGRRPAARSRTAPTGRPGCHPVDDLEPGGV